MPSLDREPSAETIPVSNEAEGAAPSRRGKRSDPKFTQITAYIPVELHADVKMDLLKRKRRNPEERLVFSALLSLLLSAWHEEREGIVVARAHASPRHAGVYDDTPR